MDKWEYWSLKMLDRWKDTIGSWLNKFNNTENYQKWVVMEYPEKWLSIAIGKVWQVVEALFWKSARVVFTVQGPWQSPQWNQLWYRPDFLHYNLTTPSTSRVHSLPANWGRDRHLFEMKKYKKNTCIYNEINRKWFSSISRFVTTERNAINWRLIRELSMCYQWHHLEHNTVWLSLILSIYLDGKTEGCVRYKI